jgi:hypothetical protein
MSNNFKEEIKIMENSQIQDYFDTEDLKLDKDKKSLIEKVIKSSAELEGIGIIAKDLNHNIEVYNKFF